MSVHEFVTAQQTLAMFWVFGWLFFFLALKFLNDRRKRHRLELIAKERLAALEKGVPMPELPDYDDARRPSLAARMRWNPRWPLGAGAMSILLGIGSSIAMWLSGDPYHNQVWPFGLLGVFFGVGLFLHYALTRDRSQ